MSAFSRDPLQTDFTTYDIHSDCDVPKSLSLGDCAHGIPKGVPAASEKCVLVTQLFTAVQITQ